MQVACGKKSNITYIRKRSVLNKRLLLKKRKKEIKWLRSKKNFSNSNISRSFGIFPNCQKRGQRDPKVGHDP